VFLSRKYVPLRGSSVSTNVLETSRPPGNYVPYEFLIYSAFEHYLLKSFTFWLNKYSAKVRKNVIDYVANEVLSTVVNLSLECEDVKHVMLWSVILIYRMHKIALSHHNIFILHLLISSLDVKHGW
jgi:hypothetical protein